MASSGGIRRGKRENEVKTKGKQNSQNFYISVIDKNENSMGMREKPTNEKTESERKKKKKKGIIIFSSAKLPENSSYLL